MKVIVSWLSEACFRYRDAESAVTRYRDKVSSRQANGPGAPATSSGYSVVVESKSD